MNSFVFSTPQISDVAFRTDVHKYDKTYFCLYVEGKTDKVFYERVLKQNVRCVSIDEATKSDNLFRTGSNKNTIIVNVSKMNSPPIYGVVDRDNDKIIGANGVFYTDTRDLETLLMYTDDEMYQKLDCTLTLDEVKNALFMSYQWGYICNMWKLYKNKGIDMIEHLEGCFNEKMQINVDSLRVNLKRLSVNTYPSTQELKQFKKTCKYITGSFWNEEKESIDWISMSSVWEYIRGHDFVYFLIQQNDSLKRRFATTRRLEYELINTYNTNCFKKCSLYSSLHQANLVAI